MGLSKELQIGKAGEHFVCFDLISKGYNAFLSDAGLPYDVLIDIDGNIKRIQVKTCTDKTTHDRSKNVYRFSMKRGKRNLKAISSKSIDYIGFVFMKLKIVQYVSIDKVTNKNNDIKQTIDFREKEDNHGKHFYTIGDFDCL